MLEVEAILFASLECGLWNQAELTSNPVSATYSLTKPYNRKVSVSSFVKWGQ